MTNVKILGVRIDKITMPEALEMAGKWVEGKQEKYIVTPNIEIIMSAQNDPAFRAVLNNADLAIPDSARFNWAVAMTQKKSFLKRLIIWPFFFFSSVKIIPSFPVVTGTDLMEQLIVLSAKKGYRIGLIGGSLEIADKLKECLHARYPKLEIVFTDGDIVVDNQGETERWEKGPDILKIPFDIVFVALGQKKQERWIVNNMHRMKGRVYIGVGGAFEYLSGEVRRAPAWMRYLGFEWLFRLVIQPWRVKRFGALVRFVFLIAKSAK